MEKWIPTLIVSDADGTLLDEQGRISSRTRQALTRAIDHGAQFVVATGRPPRWIAPIADELGFAPLSVCANGAVLYDSHQDCILDVQVLSPSLLHQLIDCIQQIIPDAGLAVERIGQHVHDATNPQFISTPGYEHAWLNPDNVEVSPEELFAQPAIKLLIRKVGLSSHALATQLAPQLDQRVELTYSTNDGLVEIVVANVTKATGLTRLIRSRSLSLDQAVAFGDMPNDIAMLRACRLGVAMGNAHPDVIRIADEITAPNTHDGIAQVLDRWWLPSTCDV